MAMMSSPSWINKTFLQSALKVDPTETVEILEFTPEPAVGPGENHTSDIYRVRVVYKSSATPLNQSKTLVVKKPMETGFMKEMFECSSMLDKEQLMYEVLLPNMYEKSNVKYGPRSFKSPIKHIIVMEDLKEQGYVSSNSKNQLDYSHCKIVFETIAKFHGTSISCYHDEPELVSQSVGIDSLWVDGSVMEHWMFNAIKCTVKVVKEMSLDKKFKDFFLHRADHIWEFTKVAVKAIPEGFNVLNHGDFWDNNLLFKYDSSNKVTSAKILDFQNTKFASPVVDLMYLLWSSASEDVLKNSQRDLYEIYVDELNSTLKRLGCQERWSLEELWEDLREYKDWGLFILCFCLPVQLSAPEDALDFSTFRKRDFSGKKFQKLFNGQQYRSCLPIFAKQFSHFFL